MKKIALRLHQILGLAVGLVFSLLCITGAMLVFEEEFRELSHPELYFVQKPLQDQRRLTATEVATLLNPQLQALPAPDVVTSVTIPSSPERNYIVHRHQASAMLYVDPYTGEIRGERERREGFFLEVMRLHRWLLDGTRSWGKAITGYSTLAFLLILLSGLIIWLPKSRKALRASLFVKTSANRHRLFLDLHRSLGFYTLLPLLVLCVTGLTWSFPWWRSGLYSVFGIETPARANKEQPNKDKSGQEELHTIPTINYSSWTRVEQTLAEQYPNYRTIRISDGMAEVSEQRMFGNPRATDKIEFDASTGAVVKSIPYAEQPSAQKARGWIYAIHVGSWGGWLSKSLTFVVVLIGASLPWTGLYLYAKKRRQRRRATHAQ